MVGSVATDKTKILGHEFDILFGFEEESEMPPPLEAADNDEDRPDLVMSLGTNSNTNSSKQLRII
jgi:hypothetical protein